MSRAILLRTHRFGPREAAFAARLRAQSGHELHVLADETRGPVETAEFPKVSLSPAAVRALGVPCPADFAWRCGDYGFYAARRALPGVTDFWMIEPDVRASVSDWADIFGILDTMEADFLAPHVVASERSHFWYPTMRWITPEVHRCSFAFCRMSASAADICLAERRRLAGLLPARLMWSNDETFVTTTLHRLGHQVRDVNECGRTLCTAASFGFAEAHRGEAFDAAPLDGLIYHPVLWGADYDRKVARIARGVSRSEAMRLKLLRGIVRAQSAAGLLPVFNVHEEARPRPSRRPSRAPGGRRDIRG